MNCSKCGAPNRPQARFCCACQAPLIAAQCPVCATPLRPGARFCQGCGSSVAATPTPATWTCLHCGHANRAGARFCNGCGKRHGPQTPAGPQVLTSDVTLGTGQLAGFVLKGRYRLDKLVAEGGMAVVYKATDMTAPTQVWAVKQMRSNPGGVGDVPAAIEAFHREGELLAKLAHPNLPKGVEVFEEAGRHFMVLEFIEGHTLDAILKNALGVLDEGRVLRWVRQLGAVLSYLHTQNPPIIYRDLKPSNIMAVTATDDVKLIDLGTARFYKGGKRKDTLTLGTEGYAPPEQYGSGQTDARSDIYALGMTMHHLLTREPPDTSTPFATPPTVKRQNPWASSTWDTVIAKATQMKPADRYQSIAALLKALPSPSSTGGPQGPPLTPTSQPQASPPPKPQASPPPPPAPARPKVEVSETWLNFGAVAAARPTTRSLRVRNAGGGTLSGSASTTERWLSVSPSSFSAGDQLTVRVDSALIQPGHLQAPAPNILRPVWQKTVWLAGLALLVLSFTGIGFVAALVLIGCFYGLVALCQGAVALVYWHARRLVPEDTPATGEIKLTTSGGNCTVQVRASATPQASSRSNRWFLSIMLVVLELGAVVFLLRACGGR